MNAYIIFSDLKGYSKLSEPEIKIFFSEVLPSLHTKISNFIDNKMEVWNTWGDGTISIFEDGKDACEFTLELRDFYKNYDFNSCKKLIPRIAGHFGQFEYINDPLTNKKNAFGININTSARIEPVTRPGEIFVTRSFVDAVNNLPSPLKSVAFDQLGILPLAKSFGEAELFRLRKASEETHIIDKILKQDFSSALPEPPQITVEEIKTITFFSNCDTADRLKSLVSQESLSNKTPGFLIGLSKLYKDSGLYEEALGIIELLDNWELSSDSITINPFRYNPDLLKLKANCLTRLSRYEEAANIIYGVWKTGNKDSDTLAMLAAQYKRRALYDNGVLLAKDRINTDLLKRSLELYIEAFRLNIDDYYPAINAAYLYKILGGMEEGKGIKLATYIIRVWGNREGENWWLDATLAEAEIIQGDFELAKEKFIQSIANHRPNAFLRRSTQEQVNIYSKLEYRTTELNNIIQLLN